MLMRRLRLRHPWIVIVPLALAAVGLAVLSARAPEAGPPPEPMSLEDYRRVESEFVSILKERGAGAALAELRRRVAAEPDVVRECHSIAHTLGHEAYAAAGDFGAALLQADGICNSGFFHGVIEAHFAGVEDVAAAARTVCAAYPSGTYPGWQCRHGVGHGLMFSTENDLPGSIALCEGFEDAAARDGCVNGVYMENFNVERKLHPSAYLKEDDPSFPCGEPGTAHKSECYNYAPVFYLALHPGRYAEALAWCGRVEEGFRPTCAAGVGAQALKEHLDDPALVERACGKGGAEASRHCVRGMATQAAFHYGALEPARALCAGLKRGNRASCEAGLKGFEAMFRDAR